MAIGFTQTTYPGAGATGTLVKSFNITCLAADTSGAVTHGLLTRPAFALFEPRDAAFYALTAGTPNVSVAWCVASTTDTVVNLTKNNTTGSGGATPGTTVIFVLHVGTWPLTNVNL